MLLLLLLPLAMASCGDDKDEPTNTTNDPDGTIIVNLNMLSGVSISRGYIFLDENYNFHDEWDGAISIVGHVKGIGSINITADQIQKRTWTIDAAAQVGYGYIFKSKSSTPGYYDYYAVYVASEIGSTSGVIGYTLKVRKLLENVPWQY